jgi:hypothetical protein
MADPGDKESRFHIEASENRRFSRLFFLTLVHRLCGIWGPKKIVDVRPQLPMLLVQFKIKAEKFALPGAGLADELEHLP